MKLKKSHVFFSITLAITLIGGKVLGQEDSPINLPKSEGSKTFDMEIFFANKKGIEQYKAGDFDAAKKSFAKAESLARQLRDPGLGMVSYNLGLTLHKLESHENAVKAFLAAKKFARGNRLILNSNLIRLHECGFNPSISCEEKVPASMDIEGSN